MDVNTGDENGLHIFDEDTDKDPGSLIVCPECFFMNNPERLSVNNKENIICGCCGAEL